MIILGIQLFKADYLGTARAFKMCVLLRIFGPVYTKTPDAVITHHPVHETLFSQPVEYSIERHPIQFMAVPQALFNFMMRDGTLLGKQHGKNLDAAGGDPFPTATNHFFRKFEVISHSSIICNSVAFYYTVSDVNWQ